jgi:outer membrane protein assembly factor BamD (BamD/ComL family)
MYNFPFKFIKLGYYLKYIRYLFVPFLLLFISCSVDPKINKSDLEMYRDMVGYNASSEFSKFSDAFVDLSSNHPSSIYLKDAFLIAIDNSISVSEFIMAEFYLSKMKSRFINDENKDFYDFYELKISFLKLDKKNRNQKEFLKLQEKSEIFLKKYKNSDYRYLAMDIKTSINANLYLINEKIANLYKKKDNAYSSNIYKKKNYKLKIKKNDIKEVKSFFISELFE